MGVPSLGRHPFRRDPLPGVRISMARRPTVASRKRELAQEVDAALEALGSAAWEARSYVALRGRQAVYGPHKSEVASYVDAKLDDLVRTAFAARARWLALTELAALAGGSRARGSRGG